MNKELRSELAIERDNWFESEEGIKCSDSSSLGSMQPDKFLKNRLEAAFLAGAIANEKIRDDLAEKLLDPFKACNTQDQTGL